MPRFLFYVPAVSHPVGGVNVIYEWIETLQAAGFDAEPVTDRPAYRYAFLGNPRPVHHVPDISRAMRSGRSIMRRTLGALRDKLQPETDIFELRPDDVLVVPEYAAPELCHDDLANRKVLLVQTYHWLTKPGWREQTKGVVFERVLATSQICARMAEMTGFATPQLVPLAIDSTQFRGAPVRRAQVAYMPRKRQNEVESVVEALRRRGRMAEYDFVAIDRMPHAEVARVLSESRIFLAFSRAEGFGLPPAEAMAAGCLVAGFTGAGGDEFFTPDIAFPVSDGNLPVLVDTVEGIAAEYRRDPTRLDAMARAASQRIAERYSPAAAQRAVIETFRALSEGIEATA